MTEENIETLTAEYKELCALAGELKYRMLCRTKAEEAKLESIYKKLYEINMKASALKGKAPKAPTPFDL